MLSPVKQTYDTGRYHTHRDLLRLFGPSPVELKKKELSSKRMQMWAAIPREGIYFIGCACRLIGSNSITLPINYPWTAIRSDTPLPTIQPQRKSLFILYDLAKRVIRTRVEANMLLLLLLLLSTFVPFKAYRFVLPRPSVSPCAALFIFSLISVKFCVLIEINCRFDNGAAGATTHPTLSSRLQFEAIHH